jgi:hypothetical protein
VSETVEVPTPSPATIRILDITPSPGSTLTATTAIAVELEYSVKEFAAERFGIGAMARQKQDGSAWTLLTTDGKDLAMLPNANGTITVRFDARNAFEKPDVQYPFQITVAVQQLIGTMGGSVTAATTAPVTFR